MKDNDVENNSKPAPKVKRRTFIGGLINALALPSFLKVSTANADEHQPLHSVEQREFASRETQFTDEEYEAVVIGSGFGGAISACRLSARWPGKVMIAERGKRYPRGSFPRGLSELSKGFWRREEEGAPRLYPLFGESRGVFDLRSYDHMDTLVAAGYGGGSLIYGNALIEPSSPYFDESWPETIKKESLTQYFSVFKEVQNAQKIPRNDEPERALKRFDIYETIATDEDRPRYDAEMTIFFGNDIENPTPMGETEINRYGVEQTSCTYCAECIIGCNFHAKNSLDLNYLYVAEHKYHSEVKTEHVVEKIVPLDVAGDEDLEGDGSYGYHVYMIDLAQDINFAVKTKRVILSAGSYGSTEILLKNKLVYRTLPNVSDEIGKRFSGNGDFLTLTIGTRDGTDIGKGPTIIQYIDYNMEANPDRNGFLAEDMSIPLNILQPIIDFMAPSPLVKRHIDQAIAALDGDQKLLLQVHVGLDKSDGRLYLNWLGSMRLSWPYWNSLTLYNNIINATNRAKWYLGGLLSFAFPTWFWPLRRNLTVHPLGGCTMANSEEEGVTSARAGEMGQVFNYRNLYVIDGSLIPSSLGANPALTIGAISEIICEEITGNTPTANL